MMYAELEARLLPHQRDQDEVRIVPDVIEFSGPIVIIGFGSIGKGALPLIQRHIRSPREDMAVISPDDSCRRLAELEGVRFEKLALRPDNYRSVLSPMIDGRFVVFAGNSTRCTSTPASNLGLAAMSMPPFRLPSAPTMRCARRCARSAATARPRSWRTERTRAWSATCSSARSCTSRLTWGTRLHRLRAKA